VYTGGPCVQVAIVHRWSLYTDGPCTQVVFVHRWSLCTGGVFDVYGYILESFCLCIGNSIQTSGKDPNADQKAGYWKGGTQCG
jgi:hypothetical protein